MNNLANLLFPLGFVLLLLLVLWIPDAPKHDTVTVEVHRLGIKTELRQMCGDSLWHPSHKKVPAHFQWSRIDTMTTIIDKPKLD